jgi:hypothetical protein
MISEVRVLVLIIDELQISIDTEVVSGKSEGLVVFLEENWLGVLAS